VTDSYKPLKDDELNTRHTVSAEEFCRVVDRLLEQARRANRLADLIRGYETDINNKSISAALAAYDG